MSDWISDGEDGLSVREKLNGLHDTVITLTGNSTLERLSDVTISGVSNGDILTYYGSGWINSGSTRLININIPKVKIDTGYYTSGETTYQVRDSIRVYWDSPDIMFLNYNPQIWLFRRKTYRREIELNSVKMRHKKWVHEPHLNGINYPNSKYYAGSTSCPVDEIETTGRHTEFDLTTIISGEKMSLSQFDPYEWIYAKSGSTWIKMTDDTNVSSLTIRVSGRPKNCKSFPFRLAIVIDNPDPNADNPKIIGDLSDVIYMRYKPTGGNRIRYFWNEINVKMFGGTRW